MAETSNSVWNLFEDLKQKRGITEIVINGPKRVFVERAGQFIHLNVSLLKKDIYQFVQEVAGYNKKNCNDENPILDGNMPDGSRINIILEPYAHGCPAITIRKYLQHIKKFDDSPGVFSLEPHWIDFFKSAVSAKVNMVVSGGTGVGKTTFVNLLLNELSQAERVVTIEDTLELSFQIPNLVRLEARKKKEAGDFLEVRDLVKNALRMRPDRIIIGEVRGGELFDLLQAMNTGHEGSMTSVHANSPGEALQRMETLFLLAGFEVPYHVTRRQISSGVDFMVQLSRDREGHRVVNQIQEVTGMEGGNIISQTIADYKDEKLEATGILPKCMEKLHERGGLPMNFFASHSRS